MTAWSCNGFTAMREMIGNSFLSFPAVLFLRFTLLTRPLLLPLLTSAWPITAHSRVFYLPTFHCTTSVISSFSLSAYASISCFTFQLHYQSPLFIFPVTIALLAGILFARTQLTNWPLLLFFREKKEHHREAKDAKDGNNTKEKPKEEGKKDEQKKDDQKKDEQKKEELKKEDQKKQETPTAKPAEEPKKEDKKPEEKEKKSEEKEKEKAAEPKKE